MQEEPVDKEQQRLLASFWKYNFLSDAPIVVATRKKHRQRRAASLINASATASSQEFPSRGAVAQV